MFRGILIGVAKSKFVRSSLSQKFFDVKMIGLKSFDDKLVRFGEVLTTQNKTKYQKRRFARLLVRDTLIHAIGAARRRIRECKTHEQCGDFSDSI